MSFITFEGGEGSGKSTQVKLLADVLGAAGKAPLVTREPGGTPNAEAIRKLLVAGDHEAFDPVAETLLFYAARVEHVQKIIRPALEKNRTVLCDRFTDSTLVYQGVGKQLGEAHIRMLHQLTLGNFAPDLTIIFDIDPALGLSRTKARAGGETRFEEMEMAFHRAIRAGFLAIAGREPQRCVMLDAAQDKDALHRQVLDTVRNRLG